MKAQNLRQGMAAALMAAALLLPGCLPARAPDCTDPDILCAGLVTDGGDIRDRAFNQATWEGLEQARSRKVVDWVEVIETADVRDYERNMAVFTEAGYDIILTAGEAMSETTVTAAIANPETFFIGVDQFQAWAADDEQGNDRPNLAGISFPEQQAGFLMGALAAMMTGTGQVGAVCSSSFHPGVFRYCEGYRQGVTVTDPEVAVDIVYHDDVQVGEAFTDPAWGADTAASMVERGVDIVFAAGGETASSALTAAVERGAYGLGADFDQYTRLVEASPRLLSSGMKSIAPAILSLLEQIRSALEQGEAPPAGNFSGEVGYAPFHDLAGSVPEEVRVRLEEMRAGLLSGEIEINLPASILEP